MAITAADIQKLREETGAGVMECKKALEEAGGDSSRAKEIIKERGLAKGEKRAGRETGAGLIKSYVHNGRIGVLVDVRAETDFVVRSEPFQQLATELAMQLAAVPAATPEELMNCLYVRDESRKVSDLVNDVIAKTGENIRIGAIARLEL